MAASILSQDVLSICLILAKGDISLNMEEIISRVNKYQEVANRHFGITRGDFYVLFCFLLNFEMNMNLGIKPDLTKIMFKDIILKILEYGDAYFNDEGSYWTSRNFNITVEY